MTTKNVKRQRHAPSANARTVPCDNTHAYLIQKLGEQISAMQQDLIECDQVRLRTIADIKHVRRQIAALKRKCTSDTSTERRTVCPNGASAPQTQARSAGLSAHPLMLSAYPLTIR